MKRDQFEFLVQRLERVERENRRLKIAGSIGFILVFCVVTAGAKSMYAPARVDASQVRIVDKQGKVRMVLGHNPNDGNSYINFWDDNNILRTNIWAGNEGEGFMHSDDQGAQERLY